MEFADDGDLFQKIVSHRKNGTYFGEPIIWQIFIQVKIYFYYSYHRLCED